MFVNLSRALGVAILVVGFPILMQGCKSPETECPVEKFMGPVGEAELRLGPAPEFLIDHEKVDDKFNGNGGIQDFAIDKTRNYIFVIQHGTGAIYVIDLYTRQRVRTWWLDHVKNSGGISVAYDDQAQILYICTTMFSCIVDASDPHRKDAKILSQIDVPCYDVALDQVKRRAYVSQWAYTSKPRRKGNRGGVHVIDYSQPSNAVVLHDWIVERKHVTDPCGINDNNMCPMLQGLTRDADRGYIFTARYGCIANPSQFGGENCVANFGRPHDDVFAGELFILQDNSEGLEFVSSLTFETGGPYHLTYDTDSKTVFLGLFDTRQVVAIDVQDPENPFVIATASLPGRFPNRIRFAKIDGEPILYVATRQGSVLQLDARPEVIHSNETWAPTKELAFNDHCGMNSLEYNEVNNRLYAVSLEPQFSGTTSALREMSTDWSSNQYWRGDDPERVGWSR